MLDERPAIGDRIYAEDPNLCLCKGWPGDRVLKDHKPACRVAGEPECIGMTIREAVLKLGPYFANYRRARR